MAVVWFCFSCFDWHNAITVMFTIPVAGNANDAAKLQINFNQVPNFISSFGFPFSSLLETFGFIYVELTYTYVTHA